jgi:hypothetical protein
VPRRTSAAWGAGLLFTTCAVTTAVTVTAVHEVDGGSGAHPIAGQFVAGPDSVAAPTSGPLAITPGPSTPTTRPKTTGPTTTRPTTTGSTPSKPATRHAITRPSNTPLVSTRVPSIVAVTAYPVTVQPVTVHPVTTHPVTTHPVTTHPVTTVHPVTTPPVAIHPVTYVPPTGGQPGRGTTTVPISSGSGDTTPGRSGASGPWKFALVADPTVHLQPSDAATARAVAVATTRARLRAFRAAESLRVKRQAKEHRQTIGRLDRAARVLAGAPAVRHSTQGCGDRPPAVGNGLVHRKPPQSVREHQRNRASGATDSGSQPRGSDRPWLGGKAPGTDRGLDRAVR